jgi:copper chaperone CopZ
VAAASDLKREIDVTGMACASRAQRVTAALQDVLGVGGCARRMVR